MTTTCISTRGCISGWCLHDTSLLFTLCSAGRTGGGAFLMQYIKEHATRKWGRHQEYRVMLDDTRALVDVTGNQHSIHFKSPAEEPMYAAIMRSWASFPWNSTGTRTWGGPTTRCNRDILSDASISPMLVYTRENFSEIRMCILLFFLAREGVTAAAVRAPVSATVHGPGRADALRDRPRRSRTNV